ncbi:558_t:CDS:2, partial [Entrophospora sp. SA101]
MVGYSIFKKIKPQYPNSTLISVNFELIDWEAIGETIPTMITLAYFTILSVNINISKLEASLDDHQINTDRELIVQGVSNLIAGTFQ